MCLNMHVISFAVHFYFFRPEMWRTLDGGFIVMDFFGVNLWYNK